MSEPSATIEQLRAKFLYERVMLSGAQRALEATPEYRAREEARERYEEAEAAFAEHDELGYAGFCEGCGIPLKDCEATLDCISDDGDTAPFCKDTAACIRRSDAKRAALKRAGR